MNILKRTWAEIDTKALAHNYELIKQKANTPIIAVVKANAYGHSTNIVIPVLEKCGASMYAVSNIEEALELRDLGVKKEILILGYTPENLAGLLIENGISQCIYSLESAEMFSKFAALHGGKIKAHLKLDTGMGRIGFDCRDEELSGVEDAIKAAKLNGLGVEGIFTHFAVSDRTGETEDGFTDEQFTRFSNAVSEIKAAGINPKYVHASNSAAIINDPDKHINCCRAGIILYGADPAPSVTIEGLTPAMTLKSVVSFVKTVKAGQTISYGRTYKTETDTKIATVTIGYADGYLRALSNKAEVIIGGKRAKIVGRVCMDQLCVDVTGIDVKEGDEVILFGKELTASELAEIADTINYEIFCGLSKRVPKIKV